MRLLETRKKCSTCREEKSIVDFNKNKSTMDGLHSQCKDCLREYRKSSKDKRAVWLEENKDHIRKYSAEYREENRENLREYDRKRWIENRDSESARSKRYYNENREAILLKQKERREANPEVAKDTRLRNKYKISLDDYNRILMNQNSKCAICGMSDESGLVVDHDHSCCKGATSCGKCVRALLCHRCNAGIGFLGDDASRLRKAAAYIELHSNTIRNEDF